MLRFGLRLTRPLRGFLDYVYLLGPFSGTFGAQAGGVFGAVAGGILPLMPFEMKRNDRRPRFRVQLTANELPVDLTPSSAVRFTMRQGPTIIVNKAPMTYITPSTGLIEYPWVAADTAASGNFNCEVEVDWGGGELQSFPSLGYFSVTINDDLA